MSGHPLHRLRGPIGRLLIAAALSYAAVALLLYLRQDAMLYYPDLPGRALTATPRAVGLDFEEVALSAADGTRLHGWFLPAAEARGVILFSHGNAGNIAHRLDSLRIFHRLGWAALIYDYRGYGRSAGSPSEAGTALDAEAAWRHLTEERGYPPNRVVLFGRSLGAAVTARLAAGRAPGGVILESAFTSLPDRAAELYPWLPVRLLGRYRYDTLAELAAIRAPLLVVHSVDDELIPFAHGQRLFAAAHEPKSMLEIRGGHNGGFLLSGERYVEGLRRFLDGVARP